VDKRTILRSYDQQVVMNIINRNI